MSNALIVLVVGLTASLLGGSPAPTAAPAHAAVVAPVDGSAFTVTESALGAGVPSSALRDLADSGPAGPQVATAPPRLDALPQRAEGRGEAFVAGGSTPAQTAEGTEDPLPLLRSFAGLPNTFSVAPPDPTGAIGRDHYLQAVNLGLAVFDRSGAKLLGPMNTNLLWTGFGGLCETTNRGDPIVEYDQFADRWVVTQFAFASTSSGPFVECIAVSQTPDPTGRWWLYASTVSMTRFNDYPKVGVWRDSYVISYVDFAPGYAGATVELFDRDAMLVGLPASKFTVVFDSQNFEPLLPANIEGPRLPPAGTPALVGALRVFGGPPQLELWRLDVDWASAPPTLVQTALPAVPVPDFTALCLNTRNCIPHPGTDARALDAIADRLMMQLSYRNLGDREVLVVNHTVNAGGGRAGVRWYELDHAYTPVTPAAGVTLRDSGTYAPDDGLHRWMGSATTDAQGNLAIGYSVAGSTTAPGIRFAGRLAGDPAGQLTTAEGVVPVASGTQTGTHGRWGDYSHLSVDPLDDCTFWYTQQHLEGSGFGPWHTRIAAFAFPSCQAEPLAVVEGTVADASTGEPLDRVVVSLEGISTTTGSDGTYVLRAPLGSYQLSASRFAYQGAGPVTVDATSPGRQVRDLQLSRATVRTVSGTVVDDDQGFGVPATLEVLPLRQQSFAEVFGTFATDVEGEVGLRLRVTAAGYTTQLLDIPDGDGPEDLGTIRLQPTTPCPMDGCPELGVVTGVVRDSRTAAPIDRAVVAAGDAEDRSGPAADQPGREPGRFRLVLPAGPAALTIVRTGFADDAVAVELAAGAVNTQDLLLARGDVTAPPIEATVLRSDAPAAGQLSLSNAGGTQATVRLVPINGAPPESLPSGPFHPPGRNVGPKDLTDTSASSARTEFVAPTVPRADAEVVDSLAAETDRRVHGVAAAGEAVWLGDIAGLGLADQLVEHDATTGIPTGRTMPGASGGGYSADAVHDPVRDVLWQVEVGGEGCVHLLDPQAASPRTGERICPAFGVPQRGLAHDLVTDTFYAGSFSDGRIHQFTRSGVILRSVDLGLPIAGLAVNPRTGELYASLSGTDTLPDLVVLDPDSDLAPVRGYDVEGLGAYEQSGLSIDCSGDLLIGSLAGQVLRVRAGTPTPWCDLLAIPFLDLAESTLTVAADGVHDVAYTVDASALPRGTHLGRIAVVSSPATPAVTTVPISVQALDLAGPPQVVTATPAVGSATVSWQAPEDDGGTPVLHYSLTVQPTGEERDVVGTATTISSLAAGVLHTFTVRAVTEAGPGEAAEPVAATPLAPPPDPDDGDADDGGSDDGGDSDDGGSDDGGSDGELTVLQQAYRDDTSGNAALSVALSRLAFPDPAARVSLRNVSSERPGPDEVLLATGTVFADALASGPLQARSPLLLTDPAALDGIVEAELRRLAPQRVRILGGVQAVDQAVEDRLTALGYTVVRTAGPTRLETAAAIAGLLPASHEAIVVRAHPAPGSDDPTQAFADSLAAGAWGSASGLPILLTERDQLSDTTRAHLAASEIRTVHVVGGTAAISDAVTTALREELGLTVLRVAGPTRADTAAAVARQRGIGSVDRAAVLIEGYAPNAWAGGFTSAALAAQTDAPLLLSQGSTVPGPTRELLTGDPANRDRLLLCVTLPAACQTAADLLGPPVGGSP